MAEILVEENFVRIDGDDMNALLNILDRLGIEAEPTAPRHDDGGEHGSSGWTLVVHWLNAGALAPAVAEAFPGAFAEIAAHFTAAGRRPPARVLVFGSDDTVLRTYPL